MVLGAWSLGSIIGPVVGGLLVDHVSWRYCFHINYPFCGAGFVVAALVVRLDAVEKLTFLQKLRRMDWIGAGLFIGSMTSFLVGISSGGVLYAWRSAVTLSLIVVGLSGLVVFFRWEIYKQEHTLLPMSIFGNWSAIAAFYGAMINGLLLFTVLYYWPFHDMSVRGSSPTQAGVNVLPAVLFTVPGAIVVSIVTSRIGRFRWAIWSGWTITTLACILQLLFNKKPTPVVTSVLRAVFGLGMGMALTSLNVGTQAMSRAEDAAMTASMYGFLRSLGMPLGVALAGTIFSNSMSDKLSELRLPTSIAHESESYVLILRTMLDSSRKSTILESYKTGFESVFVMLTAVSASALAFSFVIRRFSMDKKLLAQYSAR
ncbi:TRI12 multi-domain protein [Pyrenophora tritici-repentis]|uniref:Major facilitator superfamily (MFS) profile domain-containing protein n=1 Tax=Pyrenophora tritici-repentis (strain Pt-1C-BFP) TaxID=426418 RepID=B2WMF7_PYRTR|nr:uncharacterized protein PTRG_11167 [Pyrenophora tritici-repentis Pt-1C-BFP]KAI0585441.1 TRI12 multi-domain protein [Pyrenophora tritici-repentis]EDU44217.1 conserved hypothetical protein [Pyrenophora tritici-repentis Pt-1C-BFP]KAI0592233.1 hypothetical protein Alg130_00520 [Pyrenophora tritici-repentis]KAI0615354.1 TRI12 multi-domain protein [Pyrenophora tritici-repentis]KAI0626388.1 TRI12 multi-domain protein [Pyrenophora tritici-repentis]